MSARGYVDRDGDIWLLDAPDDRWVYLTDSDGVLAHPDGPQIRSAGELFERHGPLAPISPDTAAILLAQARRNAREGGPL